MATDAYCSRGYAERERQILAVKPECNHFIVLYARIRTRIFKRWFLIDAAAFETVLGKGCNAPNQKCAKDRYKYFYLRPSEMSESLHRFGGLEYARDIAGNRDLQKASRIDDSFNRPAPDLRNKFIEW